MPRRLEARPRTVLAPRLLRVPCERVATSTARDRLACEQTAAPTRAEDGVLHVRRRTLQQLRASGGPNNHFGPAANNGSCPARAAWSVLPVSSAAMRSRARSAHFGFFSVRMARRARRGAATPVVPLPQ